MAVKASALISLIRVDDGAKGDRGPQGATGSPGKDGTSVTITSQATTYQASSSGTTVPTGTWVANPPSVAKGQYLWTRTVVNYSDGKKTTAYSVGYQGTNGVNGQNGSNGIGVKATEVTYQIWANGTTTPSGTWSKSVPDTTADKPYLWTRTVITYTDSTKSTSYSIGSTLKGVNVGGRNLIIGSSNADSTKWTKTGWTGEMSAYDAHEHIYKITAENGWTEFFYTTLQDYVGKVVTLHLLAQNISEETTATDSYALMYANSKIGYHTGYLTANKPVQDKWMECSVTFTLNDNGMFGIGMQCQPESNNLTTTWLIKNLKLELGNIATDWTPAPEDVDADINSANNAASVAQDTANKAMNNAIQAQGTSTDAFNKANQALSSADNASNKAETAITSSKEAQTLATQAQSLANKANSDAYNAMEAIKAQNQVFYADSTGAHIRKAGTNNETRVVADGVEIIADNTKVAEFTKTQGRVSNLVADKFLYVGAHRLEKLTQDGEVGTGFFWTGGTL